MQHCKAWMCIMALCIGLQAWGCSDAGTEDRGRAEPSALEHINQRAADKAVGALQQPLNKARRAQQASEQHARELNDTDE